MLPCRSLQYLRPLKPLNVTQQPPPFGAAVVFTSAPRTPLSVLVRSDNGLPGRLFLYPQQPEESARQIDLRSLRQIPCWASDLYYASERTAGCIAGHRVVLSGLPSGAMPKQVRVQSLRFVLFRPVHRPIRPDQP